MSARARVFVCLGLAAAPLAAPPVGASDLPPQDRLAQPRSMFSPSRRFVVAGLPPARGMEWAVWADETAERIQRVLGAVPFDRGDIVEINVSEQTGAEASVEARQECADGRIRQVLAIEGGAAPDREQAEESLGSLLVSRYIQAYQTAAARCEAPARAPDWLVVGLVHRTRGDTRRRDMEIGLRRWSVGDLEPLDTLLELFHLPPGRWPQKADATLLVQWILDSPRGPALLAESFRAEGQGRRPDVNWWAERLVGAPDPRAAERAWDLWLAHQQGARRHVGAGDAAPLLSALTLPAEELDAVRGPMSLAGAPVSALIAHRKAPWARQLAVRLALRIRLSAVGQEEQVAALAETAAQFLEAVARAKSRRAINALWKTTESRHRAMEHQMETRRRYLDLVEARLEVGPEPVDAAQLYLDAVERRLSEP